MKVCAAITTAVIALVSTSLAVAGPNQDKADELFKKGKLLLAQQQYREACAAFEDSQKLDPATGTALNVALCYEGWGKLARAQRAYLEAEKLAAIKNDPRRASAARQRADALTPRIPRVTFSDLPDPLPADLVVRLDDEPVGLDALRGGISTDPGPHALAYQVAGARKVIRFDLAESQTKEIKLDLPAPKKVVVTRPDPDHDQRPVTVVTRRGRGRRILGLVVGGVGLAAMGGGGLLALSARSSYKSAFAAHCDAMNTCDDAGYKATHDARRRANLATVVVGGGAALVITGVIVFLTAPSGVTATEHAWIAPVVTEDGAAVVIGGAL